MWVKGNIHGWVHYITTAVELYQVIVWSNPKSDLPDFLLCELLSEKIPKSLSVKADIWNNGCNYPLELSSIYFKSGFSNLNLLQNLWRMKIHREKCKKQHNSFQIPNSEACFPVWFYHADKTGLFSWSLSTCLLFIDTCQLIK